MIERDRRIYCVDFERKLLFLDDGRVWRIAAKCIAVDIFEGHRPNIARLIQRVYLPETWDEFAYQAQLILDCHRILSASVMIEDSRRGDWYRAIVLNEETYENALIRIPRYCKIA